MPEQYAEVMRPDRIRARWRDSDGKSYEEEIDGLLAVCLQHEMDHLEGILFIDHLSRLKRDMVLKKLAKWRKEQRGRCEGGLGRLHHRQRRVAAVRGTFAADLRA